MGWRHGRSGPRGGPEASSQGSCQRSAPTLSLPFSAIILAACLPLSSWKYSILYKSVKADLSISRRRSWIFVQKAWRATSLPYPIPGRPRSVGTSFWTSSSSPSWGPFAGRNTGRRVSLPFNAPHRLTWSWSVPTLRSARVGCSHLQSNVGADRYRRPPRLEASGPLGAPVLPCPTPISGAKAC